MERLVYASFFCASISLTIISTDMKKNDRTGGGRRVSDDYVPTPSTQIQQDNSTYIIYKHDRNAFYI